MELTIEQMKQKVKGLVKMATLAKQSDMLMVILVAEAYLECDPPRIDKANDALNKALAYAEREEVGGFLQ